MKKFLTTLLLIFFLMTPTLPCFAQTQDSTNSVVPILDESTGQKETLSDKLQADDTVIPEQSTSFFTILGAILIPSLFIIICYLILKLFKF